MKIWAMKNGALIGPRNNISRGLATGRFSLDEQYLNKRNQTWPSVPTVTFIGQFQNLTDGTSFPITGINVVSPGLIVFAFSVDATAASFANSLTVNGVSATKVIENNSTGATTSLWYYELPPGASTTLSVTVTTSTTAVRGILGVYRINDYSSVVPITQKFNNGTGAVLSVDLGIDRIGSVVIASYVNSSNGTVSLTGVTQNFDTTGGEANSAHAAGSTQLFEFPPGGLLTITATCSAAGPCAIVSATWR